MTRVFLITGCSTGVGLHTAVQFAAKGHKVYASMRNTQKRAELDATAKAAGVSLEVEQLDVQDRKSIHAAVARIVAAEGRIDVLINNAGAGKLKALEEMSEAEIQATMDTNFYGALQCITAVLPHMRAARSGHIVSVSSVGGLVGQPLNEVYCAAKFALEGLIESMATYMEPFFGVKMTLVEPAGIVSDFVKNALADQKAQPAATALAEAYAPVLKTYWETITKRGSFEAAAQTSAQVATIIVNSVDSPTGALRILTSPIAKAFTAEKIAADPDGTILQRRIRNISLGLPD